MLALGKKKTQWKEDLYFAVKLAWQQVSKYDAEVTTKTDMRLRSAHIVDPFQKFGLCRKLDTRMDINPEDKTSYSAQYQEVVLKYCKETYAYI
jgi:hypothetical protein